LVAIVITGVIVSSVLKPVPSSTSSPTPTSNNSKGVFHFSFSGTVTGTLVAGTVEQCGVQTSANGNAYLVSLDGTVNGTNYTLYIQIGYVLSPLPTTYTGPGTYGVDALRGGAGLTRMLEGTLNSNSSGKRSWVIQSGSVTVNSDEQSGSISATMLSSGDNTSVQVTGNWICR
jgi:hypothetical protein